MAEVIKTDRKNYKQYHNPDGIPEEVIQSEPKRTIYLRFKTQADLDLFYEKTGIRFTEKTKTYKYLPQVSLDRFFE